MILLIANTTQTSHTKKVMGYDYIAVLSKSSYLELRQNINYCKLLFRIRISFITIYVM